MNSGLLLTSMQSFYAMHLFLEQYFYVTSSDSIGALLSCMQFLNDGDTADPVLWIDWREIVGDEPIALMQAFAAMNIFLRMYFQSTSSTNVKNMLHDISLVIDGKPGKEKIWEKWIICVDKVFE